MFPLPLCATCADLAVCASVGQARPTYPRCRRPLLGTRLDRMRQLVAEALPRDGDARFGATIDRLMERFAVDRNRFSEIFEWSLAWDARGTQRLRFSYAFPGWATPSKDASIAATLVAAAQPWGPAADALTARVLAAADHPAVAQPLVGLAEDGPRFKLYLQLHDGAVGAETLVRTLLQPAAPTPMPMNALHLIGLDVDPAGHLACKLYVSAPSPSGPLVDALGVRRALGVWRDTGSGLVATELDFGLVDNDLTPAQVLDAAAPIYPDAVAAFRRLGAAFGLALRRVSVGLDRPRLVLYYVLTDSDGKPPGGG